MAGSGANLEHMRRAIALARLAGLEEKTGRPFGSVVVDQDGQIIGEGYNQVRVMCIGTRVMLLRLWVIITTKQPTAGALHKYAKQLAAK